MCGHGAPCATVWLIGVFLILSWTTMELCGTEEEDVSLYIHTQLLEIIINFWFSLYSRFVDEKNVEQCWAFPLSLCDLLLILKYISVFTYQ